jgi:hypothetical protein
MQVLTDKEVLKLAGSRSIGSEVMSKIYDLKIGEGIRLTRAEWTMKSSLPAYVVSCLRSSKTTVKVATKTLPDGYLIYRIK